MSTILVSSNFSTGSAAKHVVSRYIAENKIDKLFFSGTVKSGNGTKNPMVKFLRYIFLFGPLISLRLFIDVLFNLKSSDVIILDSSHYNFLIPPIRILFPKVKIKILYHNNEMIFLKGELQYYKKKIMIFAFLGAMLKIPYTMLIRLIEKNFKCTIVYISTLDIRYNNNNKNNIEFFDLTVGFESSISLIENKIAHYSFIGNEFYNNHNQISEFILKFPGNYLHTFGQINFKGSPLVIRLGPYDSPSDLPEGSNFFLGSNATGFPIKSLDYLKVSNAIIHSTSQLSLNLMINPRVKIYHQK